jgi:hypothetical protein
MTSPGIIEALAREHENEIARRVACPRPMRAADVPRAARVGNLVAVAFGNRRGERRAASRTTGWGTGRP